jgi:3-oxoacyl-[acyl-carrier protein] reductase
MTKAAVAMLSMVLATEAGPHGIRVNAIAPGATITNFSQRHLYDEHGNISPEKFDAFVERMKSFSPLDIVGEAMDQALLILYLVSPAARYATGNIFRVNGGQAMAW